MFALINDAMCICRRDNSQGGLRMMGDMASPEPHSLQRLLSEIADLQSKLSNDVVVSHSHKFLRNLFCRISGVEAELLALVYLQYPPVG